MPVVIGGIDNVANASHFPGSKKMKYLALLATISKIEGVVRVLNLKPDKRRTTYSINNTIEAYYVLTFSQSADPIH